MTKKAVTKTAKKATKKVAKKAIKKITKSVKAPQIVESAAHAATTAPVTYEEISHAAFLNFMSRVENGVFGDETGDWIAAEVALQVA